MIVAISSKEAVGAFIAAEKIVAWAADQDISTVIAIEIVIVQAAVEEIGTLAALHPIVAVIAEELISAIAAPDFVFTLPAVERVIPRVAFKGILGIAAEKVVVAGTTDEPVTVSSAVERIIAASADERILAVAAKKDIVFTAAGENIIAGLSIHEDLEREGSAGFINQEMIIALLAVKLDAGDGGEIEGGNDAVDVDLNLGGFDVWNRTFVEQRYGDRVVVAGAGGHEHAVGERGVQVKSIFERLAEWIGDGFTLERFGHRRLPF